MIEKYGDGIIQELHAINNDKRVWTIKEVLEIGEAYKVKLEKILEQRGF